MHSDVIYLVLDGLLILAIFALMMQIIISKVERLKIKKDGIKKTIINSAFLRHKSILVANSAFNDDCYQAVYLIQYEDYDSELVQRTPIHDITLNYPVHRINSCHYAIVDTTEIHLRTGVNYVIEDNYTKAILVVSPDQEYFFMNVLHPQKLSDEDEDLGFIHRNKATGLPQLTRDDLKYYRVLGKIEALICNTGGLI